MKFESRYKSSLELIKEMESRIYPRRVPGTLLVETSKGVFRDYSEHVAKLKSDIRNLRKKK